MGFSIQANGHPVRVVTAATDFGGKVIFHGAISTVPHSQLARLGPRMIAKLGTKMLHVKKGAFIQGDPLSARVRRTSPEILVLE
jgi:hypothetical protein